MMDAERAIAAALALTDGIGPVLIGRLMDHFGSLSAIVNVSSSALQAVKGIGRALSERLQKIDPARTAQDLATYAQQGIQATLWIDPDYPPPLAALPDRPLIVFRQGQAAFPDPARSIAIVGTRTPTPESERTAAHYGAFFAAQGWCIVSGLARGIDTAAHRGGLSTGTTAAVLGNGLLRLYPPENAPLARQIVAEGCLMAEVHPETEARAEMLVFRNRLIAAFSRAVIVVEAPAASGALHAARRAHQLGRPVYALPNSAGNAALLAEYAVPLPPPEALWAALNSGD
jgi:DNA processing protein